MKYFLLIIFLSFFLFSCDGNSSKNDDDVFDNDVTVDDVTDGKTVIDEEADEIIDEKDDLDDEETADQIQDDLSDEVLTESEVDDDDEIEDEADDVADEEPDSDIVIRTGEISWNGDTATVKSVGNDLRTFTITTTADLRDNTPASKERIVVEKEGNMILQTGNPMIDALFAMALEEVEQNSVSQITDYSFNNGDPVDCDCFETGAKWHYVWTRDTAYAVNLGLAFVDPERSRNSLEFKVSDKKSVVGGGGMQIVQDTGTGGSWPVSTDRVSWAFGAYETLKYLEGSSYTDFLNTAYSAIVNTIENDRGHVYDVSDGLYFGEQSFLDWREQTYPVWTAANTVNIAMSKTLSTNVLHYLILDIAVKLAELKGESAAVTRYAGFRDNLKTAINDKFYLSGDKLYSSMKTTSLDDFAVHKFDLLGQSLAVLSGVADETKAKDVVANYPVTEAGPPVIWPQEPSTRVYHNRGIWPFVTAYALKSAIIARNDKAYINAFMSLVRGAALNLSNMENYEFTTLSNYYVDTRKDHANRDLTGPVVNSQRQLWSVAGFISLVKDGLFGMDVDVDSITFDPMIPVSLKKNLFPDSYGTQLDNVTIKGKNLKLKVYFPLDDTDDNGIYVFKELKKQGQVHDQKVLFSELEDYDTVSILLEHSSLSGSIKEVDCSVESNCFAPHAPVIPTSPYGVAVSAGKLAVTFTGDSGVTFNVFRDGIKVGTNVTSPWTDPNSGDYADNSYCYSVSAVNSAGLESHHADPVCYWGDSFERVIELKASAESEKNSFDQTPNASDHGRSHFADWGNPAEVLSVSTFSPSTSGTYLLQIEYGSGRSIDTGITACYKKVEVIDESDSSVAASGFVVMPHLGADNWDRWGNSSFLEVDLDSVKSYKISISDALNMSYFEHFVPYNGLAVGGGTEVYNRANISTIKLLLKDR